MLLGFAVLLATASLNAQPVTPYTVTEISRQFDPAGNLTSESRFLFGVNREGAIVSVDLDPAAGGLRQILDFRFGRTVVVNPASKSVSGFSYAPRRPSPPCENRFFSFPDAVVTIGKSAGTIEGVAVERVSVEWPNGRGMDVFMAPSLHCQILRTISRHGGLSLETHAAAGLRIGDPDPNLFQIPNGYRRSN